MNPNMVEIANLRVRYGRKEVLQERHASTSIATKSSA